MNVPNLGSRADMNTLLAGGWALLIYRVFILITTLMNNTLLLLLSVIFL